MTFASMADRNAIENEMPWDDRELPHSVWAQLSQTAGKFPSRNAVTFQMFSGANDPCETLNWADLQGKVAQTANLFRSLGVGSDDVVAFLLPNSMETVLTYLGGAVAGIVHPINPLLEADQIGAILKETNAKVLVTLRAFPKTDVAQKAAEAVDLAPNVKTVVEVDLLKYLTGLKKLIVPLIRPKVKVSHGAKVNRKTAQTAQLQGPDRRSRGRLFPYRRDDGHAQSGAASQFRDHLQLLAWGSTALYRRRCADGAAATVPRVCDDCGHGGVAVLWGAYRIPDPARVSRGRGV